jgi:putative SOS response-associated peptidase YedK
LIGEGNFTRMCRREIAPSKLARHSEPSQAGKQPYDFTRTDGEPMTFAGLWDEWKDRVTGEKLKSCTMIITEPNTIAAEIHDRMPVILERPDFDAWLNHGGTALLKPAANDVLQRWLVSKRVNSSRADPDDPALIEPVAVTEMTESK